MSQTRKDLDNSLDAAKQCLERLKRLKDIDAIYINGSRSPLSKRTYREESDWDFVVVSDKKITYYPNQRAKYNFHADVIFIRPESLNYYSKVCEIWPQDNTGFFNA